MKKFMKTDMYGLPLWVYLIVVCVYALALILGKMPANLVGAVLSCYIFGVLCYKLGDSIPFINKFLGGGAFFCMFVIPFINWLGWIPTATIEAATVFMKDFNYLDFSVSIVVVGSLLGMKRKTLISAGLRYFVPVIIGIIATFALTGLVGAVLGYGFAKAILYVAAPIMGGGLSAGAIPLSATYESVMGLDAAEVLSTVTPIFNIGNLLAILAAALLAGISEKKTAWSGNGQLLKSSNLSEEDLKEKKIEGKINNLLPGAIFALAVYTAGSLIYKFVPSIHTYAWMILLAIILKVANVVPESVEDSCVVCSKWFCGHLLPFLMVLTGFVYMDFAVILDVFKSPVILLLCVVVIVVAVISTALAGKLVGFYPIESSVCAGLCMANMGGTGDVATLGAYKHMELMPFAAISSRLGGAILILIMSLIATLLQLLL